MAAQTDFSVSNLFRYGSGERSIGSLKNSYVYRENLTEVKFKFLSNFTAGARILYDDPPEVGKRFTGISRKFIAYRNDDLEIRLGNSSELYGKGLAINLFENRGLSYDTWLNGITAKYEIGDLKASILSGWLEFTDSTNFWRTEEYLLFGANTEYKLNKMFSFGVSFVRANGTIPLPQITSELKAEVGEFYFSLNTGNFRWLIDYSHKWTGVKAGESSRGFGIYSLIGYNFDRGGLTFDYKNYSYDERNPYERNDFTRSTRMLPFQNPPTVMKEHSYLFLSRSLQEIDFNDEVGLQVEIFYSLGENTNINLNASASSRHDFYKLNRANFQFDKEVRSNNFLPSLDDRYSPFREGFLEVEHSLSESTDVNFGIARRIKTIYNDFTGDAGTHKIRSTVFPFYLQHSISQEYSVTVQYEHESVFDNYNSGQNNFSNQLIAFTGNFISKFTFGMRYEFTNNENEISGRKDWFSIEGGYRISGEHNFSISYGRERGGQICSNGVCRYIQPFDGIRVTFISNI